MSKANGGKKKNHKGSRKIVEKLRESHEGTCPCGMPATPYKRQCYQCEKRDERAYAALLKELGIEPEPRKLW